MHLLFQHTYVPGQNKQHREQRTTAPSHVKKLTITTTSTSITNDEVIMVSNSTCYISMKKLYNDKHAVISVTSL